MVRLLLIIAILGLGNLSAGDLTGTWTGTMETNGSQSGILITLI